MNIRTVIREHAKFLFDNAHANVTKSEYLPVSKQIFSHLKGFYNTSMDNFPCRECVHLDVDWSKMHKGIIEYIDKKSTMLFS